MRHVLATMAATFVAAAAVGAVAAQDAATVPDLRGSWVGSSESMVLGSAAHHDDGDDDGPRLSEVELTLAIDGQDGRRFWGTVSSERSNEAFMGVIGFDGTSFVARDVDGYMEGDLSGDDTMHMIYSHAGDSTVVGATTFTRQD